MLRFFWFIVAIFSHRSEHTSPYFSHTFFVGKTKISRRYPSTYFHPTLVFLIVFSLLYADIHQIFFLGVYRAYADTTGAKTPGANTAVTTSAGDNNGFEVTPGNVTVQDSATADDLNTGTGNAVDGCATFNQSEDDAHDFHTFGFSIPTGSRIDGITVDTYSDWDLATAVNELCVELSWNGGTSWTSTGHTTGDVGTILTQVILGGSANTWGRTWTVSELSDANFRMRIMSDAAASNLRDASLDYLSATVTYSPPVVVSGTIYADDDRLQQVFWNLLSNAVKFTPNGGRVTIALKRVAASIEIRLSDSGPGITPEFLPFVFDRFSAIVTCPPLGVNFTAFDNRFQNTCCRRSSSA